MKVPPERIAEHLTESLKPVYLVAGDEPLLIEEACDAITRAARDAGYTERSVHHVDGRFDWNDLSQDAASLSLFAERKILDVRVPVNGFGRDGSAALRDWIETFSDREDPDNLLLLRTGRLDGDKQKTAWYKAVDRAGVIAVAYRKTPAELPRWLATRLAKAGIEADSAAVRYLSDRVEGNLLAAVQEIHKLTLLDLPQPVTVEALGAALDDSSRYNSFELLDAVMAREPARVAHILEALHEEGVPIFGVVGALLSQLDLKRVPRFKRDTVEKFLERIRDPAAVYAECGIIEQQAKGQLRGDAWVSLERLMMRLSGARNLSLPSEDLASLA